MSRICPSCKTPFIQVDLDHWWPGCSCKQPDPFCRRCEGGGEEWIIVEDPDTGLWHQELAPCRCTQPMPRVWTVVGIAAVLLPLLLVLWEALK